MIAYRRYGVRIVETWFDTPTSAMDADLVDGYQLAAPLEGAVCRPFETRLIDLRSTPDALFAAIKKDTRREIRRAEDRDHASFEVSADAKAQLPAFCEFYDAFAVARRMPRASRPHLDRLARSGHLILTRASASDATVWHAYVATPSRARLLLSGSSSADEQLRGRLNRFHHWRDILALRDSGRLLYDLGGWYGGTEDQAKIQISRFKDEFGGEAAREFNCTLPLSVRGRVYAALRRAQVALAR